MELRVCREEEHSFYAFVCPECYQTVTKPVDLHLELESPDWWSRFQAACR